MFVVGHEKGGKDAPDHKKYSYFEPNQILFELQEKVGKVWRGYYKIITKAKY